MSPFGTIDATTEPGGDSPLSAAIYQRDRDTLGMVKDAIAENNVLLAFQPVVQVVCPDRPAFFEGLIRVLDHGRRVIPACDFLETIETTEVGRQIDCLALELGLRTLADHPHIRLSINISARSIGYPKWLKTLEHGLQAEATIAERLILEITESSAMVMPDIVQVFMADLQRRGIAFALDDFGAGYTSFRYLRDFYFDVLKIDGQFIRGIHDSPDNQVLTQSLVALGRHFEMFTVAESVETREDAEFLTEIGVDCMQGFYFGQPSTRPDWSHVGDMRQAV